MAIHDFTAVPDRIALALRQLRRDCAPAAVSHHKDWKQGADVVRIGGFEQRIPDGAKAIEAAQAILDLRNRYLSARKQLEHRRRFRTRQRSIMAKKPRAIRQKVVLWGWP